LRNADFRKEVEVLRENLHSAEQERDKLRESCKGLEQQRTRYVDEITHRHNSQIEDLERELEEKERAYETQISEVQ